MLAVQKKNDGLGFSKDLWNLFFVLGGGQGKGNEKEESPPPPAKCIRYIDGSEGWCGSKRCGISQLGPEWMGRRLPCGHCNIQLRIYPDLDVGQSP